MEFQIELNSVQEAVKLVTRLEEYGCRADAWIDNRVIDARSLMGIMEFGMGKMIRICIYPEIAKELQNELFEMLTA